MKRTSFVLYGIGAAMGAGMLPRLPAAAQSVALSRPLHATFFASMRT